MNALDKIDAIHNAMLGNPAMHEWLGEIEELRAEVVELIEADEEYNAASHGYNPLFADKAAVLRRHAAVDRRRAALAAMGGKV